MRVVLVAASGVEEYDAPLPPGLLGPRSVTRSQNFKLRHYPVLGGLAEFERELILARTSDGRARAKARGVQFGRRPKLTAHQRQEALQRLQEGEAQADVARSYNVSQATVSRLQA
jgi:DNA invertase Pin-like site-specific DNA recombinase